MDSDDDNAPSLSSDSGEQSHSDHEHEEVGPPSEPAASGLDRSAGKQQRPAGSEGDGDAARKKPRTALSFRSVQNLLRKGYKQAHEKVRSQSRYPCLRLFCR